MEQLPDDVLLVVMRHLEVPDVFNCRLVSKRLGGLALHPDVWQHRELGCPSRLWCPVLRLAPCLKGISTVAAKLPSELPVCRLWAQTWTRCAVKQLELFVEPTGGLHAAAVIRKQEALGRLRHLEILLCDVPADEATLLLWEVALTSGLQTLDLYDISACPSLASMVQHSSVSSLISSLRCFICFQYDTSAEPFVHLLLATHAATLEDVQLGWRVLTSTATALLLAGMPNLRSLRCPLLPGLEALAATQSLRKLTLSVCPKTRAAAPGAAEAFFRRANQLQEVDLSFSSDNPDHIRFCADLVLILASSGWSRLESLSVSTRSFGSLSDHDSQVQPLYAALLAALPALPALRTLELDDLIKELLLGINPITAPALQRLFLPWLWNGGYPECVHGWLHKDVVKHLQSVNPSLQLFVSVVPRYCSEKRLCVACSHCRLRLWNRDPVKEFVISGSRKTLIPRNNFCP